MVKDEMLLVDKKVFGDNEEHEYDVECFDGLAFARPTDGELENNPNAPKLLELSYPKLDTLTDKQKEKCLEYRGLYNEPINNCNYADVCMKYGMIVGTKLTTKNK